MGPIGLVWDMDGVLVDSGQAHYAAWKALFDELGHPLTAEQVSQTLGMSNLPILKMWLGADTPKEMLVDIANRKERYFRSLVGQHVHLLPGAGLWLERARQRGYRQAVASSAPMANITAIIEALGIGDAFDLLISGTTCPRASPTRRSLSGRHTAQDASWRCGAETPRWAYRPPYAQACLHCGDQHALRPNPRPRWWSIA